MTTQATRSRLALAFAAVYLVWGSTYLAIRVAVHTLPPFLMAAVRFFVAGCVLLAFTAPGRTRQLSAAAWRSAFVVGGLMFLGGNGLLSWAEQGVDSGVAALVIAAIPVWFMLLEWIAGRRRPAGRALVGVGLGIVGVAILVIPGQRSAEVNGGPLQFCALLTASVLWAIGSLYGRRASLPAHSGLSTALQMIAGSVFLFVVATLSGEWSRLDPGAITPESLLAVLYLVVFGSLVAFNAYSWLLRATSAVNVGTYAFVNPVIAVFLGWSIGGERLHPTVLVAGATIIAGVVLVMLPRRKVPAPRS